jgi:hypothetical protein
VPINLCDVPPGHFNVLYTILMFKIQKLGKIYRAASNSSRSILYFRDFDFHRTQNLQRIFCGYSNKHFWALQSTMSLGLCFTVS